jgi:hypothetical protein
MQNKHKHFKICTLLQNLSNNKNMHIQILDLISWHRETNLFRTLLFLTIIKKSMQMLEVPKHNYHKLYKIISINRINSTART